MRKYSIIGAIALAMALLTGCGKESQKSEMMVKPISIADRQAKVKKDRDQMAEQRRMELDDLIVENRYYENSGGKRIYYKADADPEFVGGEDAMNKFLLDNLNFPKVAEREEKEGTVFVDFVVSDTGQITEVRAASNTFTNIDKSFTKEAIRVVALMPDWIPGEEDGMRVSVKFSIPITFLIR